MGQIDMTPYAIVLSVLVAAVACGDGEPLDAPADSGRRDGSAVGDTGAADAGADGALRDAEAPDAPDTSNGASAWRAEPPLPVALQEISAVTVDDIIWVVGGFEGTTDVATVRRYDPASREWHLGPELPAPRHHVQLAALDGDIYVLGGMESIGFSLVETAYVLRAGAAAWTRLRDLPEPRGAGIAGVIGGRIYIAGGQGRGGSLATEVLIYDPATDGWSMGATIPTPREHLAGFVHAGQLWAVGGRRLSLGTNTDVVEIYDPASDTFRSGPSMTMARGGFATAALDGVVYAVGGEQPDRALHEAEALVLGEGAWRAISSLATPRHGHAMAAARGRVYVIGGGERPIFAAVDVVESFAP